MTKKCACVSRVTSDIPWVWVVFGKNNLRVRIFFEVNQVSQLSIYPAVAAKQMFVKASWGWFEKHTALSTLDLDKEDNDMKTN